MVALLLAIALPSALARGGDEPEPTADEATGTLPRLGPGRWREARTQASDAGLTAEQRAMIEQLEAIGYASGSLPPAARGVTVQVHGKTSRGINFYTAGHAAEAVLMDMEGTPLHRWRRDFLDIWPDFPRKREPLTQWWRRTHLYENGDLLAIFAGLGIVKLDSDSNVLWAKRIGAHHDLQAMDNGDIYVLTRKGRLLPRVNPFQPILEDFIVVLDNGGNEKRKVSVLRALERSRFAHFWPQGEHRRGDLFHTNSLQVLDGRLADELPAFRKGNVLISIHTLDLIAVVDLDEAEVVWALKRDFKRQHDPQVLDNGNLLLFDNDGQPEQSSVMELNPITTHLAWQYRGTQQAPFYSQTCGTAQRLPNGNTLITESDAGRAFEVTREGEIVWEFYNPQRAGEKDEYIATLFELVRLPPDFPTDWARGASPD